MGRLFPSTLKNLVQRDHNPYARARDSTDNHLRNTEDMQSIILAAGMGKRPGELTKNNTKCMVQVNGATLTERLRMREKAVD